MPEALCVMCGNPVDDHTIGCRSIRPSPSEAFLAATPSQRRTCCQTATFEEAHSPDCTWWRTINRPSSAPLGAIHPSIDPNTNTSAVLQRICCPSRETERHREYCEHYRPPSTSPNVMVEPRLTPTPHEMRRVCCATLLTDPHHSSCHYVDQPDGGLRVALEERERLEARRATMNAPLPGATITAGEVMARTRPGATFAGVARTATELRNDMMERVIAEGVGASRPVDPVRPPVNSPWIRTCCGTMEGNPHASSCTRVGLTFQDSDSYRPRQSGSGAVELAHIGVERYRQVIQQREEILEAFIAKYAIQPDDIEQVQQTNADSSTSWSVRARGSIREGSRGKQQVMAKLATLKQIFTAQHDLQSAYAIDAAINAVSEIGLDRGRTMPTPGQWNFYADNEPGQTNQV